MPCAGFVWHGNQSLRFRIRKWRPQISIEPAKDGGVHSDAETENQHRDRGKDPVVCERATGKAQIAQVIVHGLSKLSLSPRSDLDRARPCSLTTSSTAPW